MSESIPVDIDMLHQVPGLPIRAGRPVKTDTPDASPHIIDHVSQSSPMTTPTPTPSHIGADPAAAAMGAIQ